MAQVNIDQKLGVFWVAEDDENLIVDFRLTIEAKWNEIFSAPMGVPGMPAPVLDCITDLAQVLQIIPSRISKYAQIPDTDKVIHTVQNNFVLDYISGYTYVDETAYSLASVISWGVPSHYEAVGHYVREGLPLSEVPESLGGRNKFENADGKGGTAFFPPKEDLYLSEEICATENQEYNITSFNLSTGLPAFAGKDIESLGHPHILLDYTEYLYTNHYTRNAEIPIGGAETKYSVDGRKYYYYSGAVVFQLCFKWWNGLEYRYYPKREVPSSTSIWSPPPLAPSFPTILVLAQELLLSTTTFLRGGIPYLSPGAGDFDIFMGDGPLDYIFCPQGSFSVDPF